VGGVPAAQDTESGDDAWRNAGEGCGSQQRTFEKRIRSEIEVTAETMSAGAARACLTAVDFRLQRATILCMKECGRLGMSSNVWHAKHIWLEWVWVPSGVSTGTG
jgi:hypothetical protein